MNNTLQNNNINFGALKFRQINGIKVFDNFDCVNKSGKKVSVSLKPEGSGFETVLKDSYGKITASDKGKFENGRIYVDILAVRPQEAGKGLGMISHLMKLISMMENGLGKIEFDAALDSYSFHRRFNYSSHMTSDSKMFDVLGRFAKCREKSLSAITNEIKAFLENPPSNSFELFKKSNSLVNSFIDKSLQEKIDHKKLPDCSIPMILTRKKAIDNKDFYNSLFKKFRIDYKIS